MAQEIWLPVSGVIEKRWEERFGPETIRKLRSSLSMLASQFDIELPDYPDGS
jgi:hypothetical protein